MAIQCVIACPQCGSTSAIRVSGPAITARTSCPQCRKPITVNVDKHGSVTRVVRG